MNYMKTWQYLVIIWKFFLGHAYLESYYFRVLESYYAKLQSGCPITRIFLVTVSFKIYKTTKYEGSEEIKHNILDTIGSGLTCHLALRSRLYLQFINIRFGVR